MKMILIALSLFAATCLGRDPSSVTLEVETSRPLMAEYFATFGASSISEFSFCDSQIVITYKREPNVTYAMVCSDDRPDCGRIAPTYWREIYKAKKGKIVLFKTEIARVRIQPSEVIEWVEDSTK